MREREGEVEKTCTSNLNFFSCKNYGEIKKQTKDGKRKKREELEHKFNIISFF